MRSIRRAQIALSCLSSKWTTSSISAEAMEASSCYHMRQTMRLSCFSPLAFYMCRSGAKSCSRSLHVSRPSSGSIGAYLIHRSIGCMVRIPVFCQLVLLTQFPKTSAVDLFEDIRCILSGKSEVPCHIRKRRTLSLCHLLKHFKGVLTIFVLKSFFESVRPLDSEFLSQFPDHLRTDVQVLGDFSICICLVLKKRPQASPAPAGKGLRGLFIEVYYLFLRVWSPWSSAFLKLPV